MSSETENKVKEIILDTGSKASTDSLKNDVPLTDQGIDSLDMANILLSLEETYSINVPDEDLDKLQTINGIVEYISSK